MSLSEDSKARALWYLKKSSARIAIAGNAYLFSLDGTLNKTIVSPNPQTYAGFGDSVAIGGNKVIIGAPYEDIVAYDRGRAYTTPNLT